MANATLKKETGALDISPDEIMTSTDQRRSKLPVSPDHSTVISMYPARGGGEMTDVAKISRGEAKRRSRRIDKLARRQTSVLNPLFGSSRRLPIRASRRWEKKKGGPWVRRKVRWGGISSPGLSIYF